MSENERVETDLEAAAALENEHVQTGKRASADTADATTSPQPPPKFIRPNFDRMPPELKLLKNWVPWAAVWNGSKWTKRPIQVSGYGASTTRSKHWSWFDDARRAYERAVQNGYMELREKGKPVQRVAVGGVGFVFDGIPDENGLVFAGVDFDKVISGREIASLAEERIKRLGSYTELSVSGKGLHVIVKARPLKSGIAHHGVEMYTSGRYFTMTGAVL
jgi:putative DNA primase/helicase